MNHMLHITKHVKNRTTPTVHLLISDASRLHNLHTVYLQSYFHDYSINSGNYLLKITWSELWAIITLISIHYNSLVLHHTDCQKNEYKYQYYPYTVKFNNQNICFHLFYTITCTFIHFHELLYLRTILLYCMNIHWKV